MPKFKIGDLVTDTGKHYGITDNESVCEVIEQINDYEIYVKVIDRPDKEYVGQCFEVEEKYFMLVSDALEPASPVSDDDLSLLFA